MNDDTALMTVAALGPLGPDGSFEIPKLERGGLVRFMGPNGSGKSKLLAAMRVAQGDKGARQGVAAADGAAKAYVDMVGMRITIGRRVTKSGEPEDVAEWELAGTLDPAGFVDPGLKGAVPRDKARVEKLVVMAGLEATEAEWHERVGRELFEETIPPDELGDLNPVQIAARLKRALEAQAREHENLARHLAGEVDAIDSTLADVDLEQPVDEAELRRQHAEAVRAAQSARDSNESRAKTLAAQEEAREKLANLGSEHTVAELNESLEAARAEADEAQRRLDAARAEVKLLQTQRDEAVRAETARREFEQVLSASVPEEIPAERLEALDAAEAEATERIEQGALVRDALKRRDQRDQHEEKRRAAVRAADTLRESARSSDEVLTTLVQRSGVEGLSVQDEVLMVHHEARGKPVPVDELSAGEKWALALRVVAMRLGPGARVAVPQEATESLDPANLVALHELAEELGVTIYGAQAASGALRAVVGVPEAAR